MRQPHPPSFPAAGPASSYTGPMHGGELTAAQHRFADAPLPWVDLSTGINPRSYPVDAAAALEAWRRLPDPGALAALERAAAAAYRVAGGRQVVAAPGTQALIQILPRLCPGRRVAILGFGYQEHPASWRAAGAEVVIVETLAGLASAEVAVVVNPNNPDGRRVDPAELLDLAGVLAARGGMLVVDEAFELGGDPGLSLAPRLPPRGAVVLRSFGKFFGLAGLRLGFAVAGDELASSLRANLGPWPVSGPAIAVGTTALADTAWQQAEIGRLQADAARLDRVLARAGFAPVGGTPLFRLVGAADAPGWYERLGRAGILVRRFAERPEWLRFGLPGAESEWDRLSRTLGVQDQAPTRSPRP